jgi:hypothetical protein
MRAGIRPPSCFIVGAPKSGTTSTTSALRAHPNIFMATGEAHFFGADASEYRAVLDVATFVNYFKDERDERLVGQKSVSYLRSSQAAIEMRAFDPDARIIAMLRNPVDMLHSLHDHFVRNGGEDIKDFGRALEAEPDRRAGRRVPRITRRVPGRLCYTEWAAYGTQLQRYLDVFGREQVHVIVFDDLVADPDGVLRGLESFLELDPAIPLALSNVNEAYRVRSPTLEVVRKRVARGTGRGRLVPPPLRDPVVRTIVRVNRPPGRRAPMDAQVRARLTEQLRPEIELLQELIDRDLAGWLQP